MIRGVGMPLSARAQWCFVICLLATCCYHLQLADGGNSSTAVSRPTKAPKPSLPDTEDDLNCTDVDIRNDLRRLWLIENCTVINGYFHMVLIEKVPSTEFDKYVFKNLREVTGHMLFFRVINLVSLRQMFPNLMVIRGQQLLGPYALVFYYMTNMVEIGLKSLVAIQRGAVFSLHCPMLCHLDTIDWSEIGGLANGTKMANSFETPKTACNKAEVCRGCPRPFCWGSESCQRFYDGYNFSRQIKCHPECLGGCTGTAATDCRVCRGWKEDNRCVHECSAERFRFRLTNRCITHASCLQRNGFLHEDECVLECPAGYSETNVNEELADFSVRRCYQCQPSCPKVCDGAEIMYLSDAERLRGCTIINGTLHIRLSEDHPNLMQELQIGLGAIEEIMGILKVFRSSYIASLDFLTNLQIIHGLYTTDNSNFSLMVYENSNLQRLWNVDEKRTLKIVSRGMYFRNNPMLCNGPIAGLRAVTEYDQTNDTIDWGSNGYLQACLVKPFMARAAVLSSRNVTIFWSKYQAGSPQPPVAAPHQQHALLGYLIYYIRSNANKTSPYEGRGDVCSKFGWRSRYVALENATLIGAHYAYNLTRLRPFTRYAFYVRTYFNESINSATDEVGLSDVHEFTTKKDRPTSPLRVRTVRKSDSTITLGWQLLPSEREMVTTYHVDVFIQPDDRARLDQRNYCTHPLEPVAVELSEPASVTLCSKEFCCELEELEEDDDEGGEGEDEEEEDEITDEDEFFNENPQVDESGRNWGRRKKRSLHPQVAGTHGTWKTTRNRRHGGFEKMMLNIQRRASRAQGPVPRAHHRAVRNAKVNPEEEFVNRIYSQSFTAPNNEFMVTGLQPFRHYIFQLFACTTENGATLCSSYSLHSDRTAASPHYDQLVVNILADASVALNQSDVGSFVIRGPEIVMHFEEPIDSNGLTVAYYVEMKSVNESLGAGQHWDCITRLEHELRQHRYAFRNVTPGEYLLRAQTMSLAGAGPPSEWMFARVLAVEVPERDRGTTTGLRDGLIAFGVLLVIGIAAAGAFFWWQRKRSRGAQDDKIPLAVNDGNQVNLDDGFVNCSLK
ncbi:insulin-like peptide receptor [Anopheles bellator]|uniref:insulin-like peptide receptor n=1 Tax=Anopheles bellator TaxID=139047 RepID=UPI002647F43F|nr:insulin-like peptide receptor [Anopheles bellator]